jgi:putative tryptophan/tyrosine transport system substrate-binding protein
MRLIGLAVVPALGLIRRLFTLALALVPIITITQRAEARWSTNPTVTVVAPADDARTSSVGEAVALWNRQLADIGSSLRIGPVENATRQLPTDYLQLVSQAVLRREPQPDIPSVVRALAGPIIVALSDDEFVSFAASIGPPGRVLIGISRRHASLAQPNVTRHLVAHELGHALGLGHNSDPATLMCGRPAPCEPQRFAAFAERYLLLTEAEKKTLLRLYPRGLAQTPQTGKVKRVGGLWQGTGGVWYGNPQFEAFLQSLAAGGYLEGQNVTFAHRWWENRHDSLHNLAGELARLDVDVLVADSSPAIRALADTTTTIPIVALSVGDPVGTGLATSLARPGGNITGVSGRVTELNAKLVELLKTATPRASRIAVMIGPPGPIEPDRKELEVAARALGVRLQFLDVRRREDLEIAFDTASKAHAEGVVLMPAIFFAFNEARIAEFALKRRLPTIFWRSWFAEAGGLMAYGPDITDLYRRAGRLVAKVLSGVRPADLPIEQADRFRLIINLKTAKALGLTIPQTLLMRADQVIE